MTEEKKIQDIFNALKNEALTERERFVMRKELELLMHGHPLRVPLHIRIIDRYFSFDTPLVHARRHAQIVAATLVLVLLAGTGTSYAAESALPGDLLYPIKINVNEQVQSALAVTPQAKVAFSVAKTERRLEEAEALAAEGALTRVASSVLALELASSTADFDSHIAALAKTQGGEEAVADAQSDREAALVAHAQVLSALSAQLPDASQAITPILSVVQQQVDNAVKARTEAQGLIAGKKNDSIKAAATAKKQIAVDRLQAVRALTDQKKDTLGTSTDTYIDEQASSTAQSISTGDTSVNNGDYLKALESYQSAIRAVQETQVGIQAQINIQQHLNILNATGIEVHSGGIQKDGSAGSSNSND